jgi:hypothetical protein
MRDGGAEVLEAIRTGDEARLKEALRVAPDSAATRDETGVSALLTALYHHRMEMARLQLTT